MLIIVRRNHGGFLTPGEQEKTIARLEHADASPEAFGRLLDLANESIQNDVKANAYASAPVSYQIVIEGIVR